MDLQIGDKVRFKADHQGGLMSPKKGDVGYVWKVISPIDVGVRTEGSIKHQYGGVVCLASALEVLEPASEHGLSLKQIYDSLQLPPPPPFEPKQENVDFWEEIVLIINNDEELLTWARHLKQSKDRNPPRFYPIRQWERSYSKLLTVAVKFYLSVRKGEEGFRWCGLPSMRGIEHPLDRIYMPDGCEGECP